jgi:hypothetical protein
MLYFCVTQTLYDFLDWIIQNVNIRVIYSQNNSLKTTL